MEIHPLAIQRPGARQLHGRGEQNPAVVSNPHGADQRGARACLLTPDGRQAHAAEWGWVRAGSDMGMEIDQTALQSNSR